jgi:hypothetical protein
MTKITPEHLTRGAFVYVRQSTADQVLHNHESRRRQYALVDRTRQLGWQEVVVIDNDLGRSGLGSVWLVLACGLGFELLVIVCCLHSVYCFPDHRVSPGKSGLLELFALPYCHRETAGKHPRPAIRPGDGRWRVVPGWPRGVRGKAARDGCPESPRRLKRGSLG